VGEEEEAKQIDLLDFQSDALEEAAVEVSFRPGDFGWISTVLFLTYEGLQGAKIPRSQVA